MEDFWTLREKAVRQRRLTEPTPADRVRDGLEDIEDELSAIESQIEELEHKREGLYSAQIRLEKKLAQLEAAEDEPEWTEQERRDYERTLSRLDGRKSLRGFEWWTVPLYPPKGKSA